MNFVERALTFDCEGEQLVGVVAEPEIAANVAVLVVVGGPQYRVGSHRQFVLLSRRLAAEGITAMRFDCRGMGDGTGGARTFEDCAPDIEAAVDRLLAGRAGIEHVVLWGLCDAASAALLYWHAVRDTRIAGMVLLNPWVRSEATLAKTHLKHYYGKRLLHRDFWSKLLAGGVNAAEALRAFAQAVVRALARTTPESAGGREAYQRRMALGLRSFPGPVLLILSGRDLTAREFLEYSGSDPELRDALALPNVERRDLADADHTFSSASWSGEVESRTLDWLSASFLAATR